MKTKAEDQKPILAKGTASAAASAFVYSYSFYFGA